MMERRSGRERRRRARLLAVLCKIEGWLDKTVLKFVGWMRSVSYTMLVINLALIAVSYGFFGHAPRIEVVKSILISVAGVLLVECVWRSYFQRAIAEPPGSWMEAFAATVFSRETKERVFDQVVAEYRNEFCEALRERAGRTRLFFLHARNCGYFVSTVLEELPWIGRVISFLKGAG